MLTELAAVYLTPINKNKIYTETGSRKQAADVQNHSSWETRIPSTNQPPATLLLLPRLRHAVAQLALLPLPAARTFKGHY